MTIAALDPESAVQLAAERVELFTARVLLSLWKQIQNCGIAWVQGQPKLYSIERLIRGIKIGALHRENRIWLETEPDPFIDPAIELLAPLQSGATNTAIAGGWAAIESLLAEPKNAKADPAERLATIVACSFPRAELTFLVYSLGKQHPAYKELLEPHVENRDKAAFVAASILDGSCPEPLDWSDKAALQRMREVLTDPQQTLASLIKKLETEGIGRPSTYPETLKKIISTRHYVDEHKRKLAPTELGKFLVASLTGHFSFVDYSYTRDLEQHLDDIASGKAAYSQVLSDLDAKLNLEIGTLQLPPTPEVAAANLKGAQAAEQAGYPCPKCKEGIVRRPHGQDFYGCSRYKEGCAYKIGTKLAGKTLTDNQAATLITKGQVGPMKGFTSKAGKPFEASLMCCEGTGWKAVFNFSKNKEAKGGSSH